MESRYLEHILFFDRLVSLTPPSTTSKKNNHWRQYSKFIKNIELRLTIPTCGTLEAFSMSIRDKSIFFFYLFLDISDLISNENLKEIQISGPRSKKIYIHPLSHFPNKGI